MNLTEKKHKESLLSFVILGGSLILYSISFFNYPLFHSLIEIFTVVVAFGIFVIAWSVREYVRNDFFLIIGIAYLFVGTLDILHTFTYRGIDIIPEVGLDVPTQLWIAARYLSSISFLAAFLFLGKRERKKDSKNMKIIALVAIVYSILFTFILLAIFRWKIFPPTFVEGSGLTDFKKISEYMISFLFLLSIFLLYKKRNFFHEKMATMLFFSLGSSILSELFFTGYGSVFGFSNMLGHLFKFMAFIFLYRAFIDFGLKNPYEFLFLDLKKSEESLKHKASFPTLNPNPVVEIDLNGKISFANPAAQKFIQNSKTNGNIFFPESEKDLLSKLKRGESTLKYTEVGAKNRFWGITLFAIPDLGVIRIYAFDITDRKKAEEELKKSQQKLLEKVEKRLVESYEHVGLINRKISIILEMEEYSKDKAKTDRMPDYIIRSAINLSGANVGAIYEYNENKFRLVSHFGLENGETEAIQAIDSKRVRPLEIILNNHERISGFCELIDIGPLNIDKKINYFVILPLTRSSLLGGIIFLGFKWNKSLDRQDLEFLEVFSLHAGRAFLNNENRSV